MRPHLLLDLAQDSLLGEGLRQIEVVVEPVLDRGPEAELHAGVQLLDGRGHQVGHRVAEGREGEGLHYLRSRRGVGHGVALRRVVRGGPHQGPRACSGAPEAAERRESRSPHRSRAGPTGRFLGPFVGGSRAPRLRDGAAGLRPPRARRAPEPASSPSRPEPSEPSAPGPEPRAPSPEPSGPRARRASAGPRTRGSTPRCSATSVRTRSMRPSTSVAVAPPAFTMKFAWRSLTSAPPIRRPFRPQASTSCPAVMPPDRSGSGFLKTQPALAAVTGWVAFLARMYSLTRSSTSGLGATSKRSTTPATTASPRLPLR